MKFRAFGALSFFLLFLVCPVHAPADNSQTQSGDSTAANPSPQPAATPLPADANTSKPNKNTSSLKALFLHKPMPSPSWGKVIQYHRDQILALSEKNRETLHEFLFQDNEGVVRTAIFHENASGGGYWEVWIWDQP